MERIKVSAKIDDGRILVSMPSTCGLLSEELTLSEAKKLIQRLELAAKQIDRTGRGITNKAAEKLAKRLYRDNGQGLVLRAKVDDDHFVFIHNGVYQHSLALSTSTEQRILAHWDGFCELRGVKPNPAIGSTVSFPSGSSPSGRRTGKVVGAGPKRVKISYKFINGRPAADISVPIEKLVF